MNIVKKFYLRQAVYDVKIDGYTAILIMDYAGNKYVIKGKGSRKIKEIARALLESKHGVNFAYKFNGKLERKKL